MHPVSTKNTVVNLPCLHIHVELNYLSTISMTCIIPLRGKEWRGGGGCS